MEMPQDDQAGAALCTLASRPPRFDPIQALKSNGFVAPPRRFDPGLRELIDQPGVDRALLLEELGSLEHANRCFGGHWLVLQSVQRLLGADPPKPLRVLDLATGAGDIPRAISKWCRQRGLPVAIVAVDHNPAVLDIAREACENWPEIHLEQHDVLDLPYPAESFDLVLCSLALHHFTVADAVEILRRIQALASLGYVVNDLRRNWLMIWATELAARTVIRSPLMRQDAPQSCRAAFTIAELESMARQAGLMHFSIERHHGIFRMVLEGRK